MVNDLTTGGNAFKVQFNPAHLQIENYDEMKEMVAAYAERYDKLVFEPEDKAGLSAARSDLLALDKALDTERKNVKRVYNQPLDEFENKIKYLKELIGVPLEKVRDSIKEIEDAEVELREDQLIDYLTRLLEDEDIEVADIEISGKWTNKGYWTKGMQPSAQLVEEVNAAIASKLKEVKAKQEQIDLLVAYCEARDVDASGWVGQLEFKDALQVISDIEAAVKKETEDAAKVAQAEELTGEPSDGVVVDAVDVPDELDHLSPPPEVSPFADDPFEPVKMTNIISVTGTREQLMQLNEYLKTTGIEVKQIG